jgi:ribonuclease P protein component
MRKKSELTLRKQKDFVRVYKKGKSRGNKFSVILYNENHLGYTRTAFVASKKVGNSVQRNRARRLMKESFYSFREKLKPGYDIVFVARNTINGKNEKDVEKVLCSSVRSCGLLGKSGNAKQ